MDHITEKHIQNNLVIQYLTFNIREKKYFDNVIYPEGFEKYHFKAAIPARNRYMVDHAQVAICYVNHDWGGAAKTYARAIKKGLQIINIENILRLDRKKRQEEKQKEEEEKAQETR